MDYKDSWTTPNWTTYDVWTTAVWTTNHLDYPQLDYPQQLTTNSVYDEWLLAKAGTIVWPFSVIKSVLFNDGLPGQI